MNTTDVPPVFHSGHYATYCLNNLLCMGSDLLLLLLMFFFLLYCGNTIDKMKKRISKNLFHFSHLAIELEKEKQKKNCFWIYFDSKSISKNKNKNFRIEFSISNEKGNFKKFFHFSILVMKLKNEKWKIFKIRFVFKSKNELYFRYTVGIKKISFSISF